MSNNTNTNVGSDNSVLGSWALYSATNDTSCNSAFGSNSLLKHTTGSFNTSLGAGAMTFNITGNRNVAVGSSALEFNTNSENNTAIGTQALFGPCDGSNNTAIGFFAGANDVSGSYNTYLGANTGTTLSQSLIPYNNSTAIGYGAKINASNRIVLGTASETIYVPGNVVIDGTIIAPGLVGGGGSSSVNSDSSGNTKIGTSSLISNTGDYNTAIGYSSLYSNGVGLNNTAIGSYNMLNNVYGSNNTAIGKQSLCNNYSGNDNTALGNESLYTNQFGSNNVAIGCSSMRNINYNNNNNNTAIGSLSGLNSYYTTNNTFLGANTDINPHYFGDLTDIRSNSTAIGYGARIDVSNQIVLGTSGEFVCIPSNRGLSIGKTTAPTTSTILDVSGSTIVSGDLTIRGIYYGDSLNNVKIGGVTGKTDRLPLSESPLTLFRHVVKPTEPITSVNIKIANLEDNTSNMYIVNNSSETLISNALFLTSTTGFGVPEITFVSSLGWSENSNILDNSIGTLISNDNNIGFSSDKTKIITKTIDDKTSRSGVYLYEQPIGPVYKKSIYVQTIKLYMGLGTTIGGNAIVPTSATEYIYLQGGITLQLVDKITIGTPIIPRNSTYLGANIKYLSDVDTSTSTAIGSGSYIDLANQIVLGTSGEFVCIPSNRGLSIGKTTASTPYALDVSGSINFLGGIYKNGEPFVSGTGAGTGSNNNSITGPLFVSGDISGNGKLDVTGDISGNSNLYVKGDISGNGKLDVTGDISGNSNLFIRGSVEASSYNATSDYRIKDNVRNLDEQDTISNLRPVKYLNKQTNKQDFGLIAHELQSEYPDLVSGEKDGSELQSVNYIGLISVLIKEVQDLKRITAAQAIEIAELKSINL